MSTESDKTAAGISRENSMAMAENDAAEAAAMLGGKFALTIAPLLYIFPCIGCRAAGNVIMRPKSSVAEKFPRLRGSGAQMLRAEGTSLVRSAHSHT